MLTNLNELVKRYTIRHSRQLKKICEPLDIHLGIPMFAYYTIENDGRFGVVCNYPKEHESFFGEKLYMECPYLTHPSLFRQGVALIPMTKGSASHNQNASHLFVMMKKLPGKIEGFFFSSPDLKPERCTHLLNNIDLLSKFSDYFKREASPILEKMLDDGYNLSQAKGKAFLSRDSNLPLSSSNAQMQQLLKTTNLLTRQEQVCLDLFKQGYTAKDSAKLLKLSKRTIEHHFENIKDKLGCSSKLELLEKSI